MANSSPPPTPPPSLRGDRRFETLTTPCEWIEAYRPGYFHPVNFGDVFNNGQYKILRKLGYGAFSTVWLASDLKLHRYVALKILVASESKSSTELSMIQHLEQVSAPEATSHFPQLLDHFEHEGPNGVHKCLVFEPMGSNANHMLEDLPQFKGGRYGVKEVWPLWMAKRILKQSLQGLAFLHQNGISHGDFQPGNILFSLKDLANVSDDKLQQDDNYKWGSISEPVQRLDGKVDKWAPKYLAVPQPLSNYSDIGPDFRIKLSDLGAAYFFSQPPTEPVTPGGLRAPELVLEKKLDETQDVWSFGCILFEFITGRQLFCLSPPFGPVEEDENPDDEHILAFSEILGPLPDHLYALWPESSLYYTPERVQFNSYVGGAPDDGTDPLGAVGKSMEDMFDEEKPDHISDEEGKAVKNLVRKILQYDPRKRPTPSQLLEDPWFAD